MDDKRDDLRTAITDPGQFGRIFFVTAGGGLRPIA
jgi:hypothetical protein